MFQCQWMHVPDWRCHSQFSHRPSSCSIFSHRYHVHTLHFTLARLFYVLFSFIPCRETTFYLYWLKSNWDFEAQLSGPVWLEDFWWLAAWSTHGSRHLLPRVIVCARVSSCLRYIVSWTQAEARCQLFYCPNNALDQVDVQWRSEKR